MTSIALEGMFFRLKMLNFDPQTFLDTFLFLPSFLMQFFSARQTKTVATLDVKYIDGSRAVCRIGLNYRANLSK